MNGLANKSRIVIVAIVAAGSAAAEVPHPLMPTSGPYRIYEMPERTDLLTPEGVRKEVYGNFGPNGQGSYRVEIPLAALRPTETPTPASTALPLSRSEEPPTAAAMATPAAARAPKNILVAEATPTVTENVLVAEATPTATATALPTPSPVACATTPAAQRETAALGRRDVELLGDIDPLVVRANRLYNQRRYVEASQFVDEILRRRPDYVRGWLMRGSLHHVLGHRDLAAEAWQKARELAGDDPDIRPALEGLR
jgi:tetratricopeptide (TPR) repeat protein